VEDEVGEKRGGDQGERGPEETARHGR
jgi:hypothetical protein